MVLLVTVTEPRRWSPPPKTAALPVSVLFVIVALVDVSMFNAPPSPAEAPLVSVWFPVSVQSLNANILEPVT